MMRPNPFLLLIGVLDFSVSDLYANRQGQLTPQQRIQLEHVRQRSIEILAGILLVLILIGIALEVRLMVIVFGTASMITMMVGLSIRFDEDLNGKVQTVSGRMRFKGALGLPLHPYYHLLIDSEDFLVSQRVKQAFDTELRYRLYYTPGSHIILSAEVAA
jgi:hypothetical protein